jgi:uncharacterized protein (TIGR01777 family)
MKLVVAGGTGFIGSALCARLREQGHTVTVLTRSRDPGAPSTAGRSVTWEPGVPGAWEEAIEGVDGLINLAGEPLVAKRWSEAQKERIRASRVGTTRALVAAIGKARAKPKFLLNGSAVGYYGPRGDEPLTEEAQPGSDFLARLCVEWEGEAVKAQGYGVRPICLRTGIVLARGGGALAKMVPPFKFFIGGPLGSGGQWMSWIQLEDEIGLILFLIANPAASGSFNATAPNPVTMKEFCKALGEVLNRPSWAPVPALALRMLLGEMADVLLTGQRVLPSQAEKLGYQFRYPTLYGALQACMPL